MHDFDHEDHAEEGEGVDGGVCLHDGPVGGDGGGGGQARRGGHAAGDDAEHGEEVDMEHAAAEHAAHEHGQGDGEQACGQHRHAAAQGFGIEERAGLDADAGEEGIESEIAQEEAHLGGRQERELSRVSLAGGKDGAEQDAPGAAE